LKKRREAGGRVQIAAKIKIKNKGISKKFAIILFNLFIIQNGN